MSEPSGSQPPVGGFRSEDLAALIAATPSATVAALADELIEMRATYEFDVHVPIAELREELAVAIAALREIEAHEGYLPNRWSVIARQALVRLEADSLTSEERALRRPAQ